MHEMTGVHCIIQGKVQGVWFRAGTQDEAKRLGLTGWVRNLPDGSVETRAFGDPVSLQNFCEWLEKGPPLAKISHVECKAIAFEQHDRFALR
jgi:acylphosphatase